VPSRIIAKVSVDHIHCKLQLFHFRNILQICNKPETNWNGVREYSDRISNMKSLIRSITCDSSIQENFENQSLAADPRDGIHDQSQLLWVGDSTPTSSGAMPRRIWDSASMPPLPWEVNIKQKCLNQLEVEVTVNHVSVSTSFVSSKIFIFWILNLRNFELN